MARRFLIANRSLLRATICLGSGMIAAQFMSSGAAALDADVGERMIANAAVLLRSGYPTRNSELSVLDRSRATLTGPEPPILIAETERCVYEMRQRGGSHIRLDLRVMRPEFSHSCDNGGFCNLTLFGADKSFSCIKSHETSSFQCVNGRQYRHLRSTEAILASARFLAKHGCSATSAKPPF